MIQKQNVVFTGLQPWDIAFGSNAKDIALEISKQNKVLYINTPLDLKSYLKRGNSKAYIHRKNVVDKKCPTLRQINPNLWILDYPFTIWPVNFLPDNALFDWMNKRNNNKMYSFVKSVLKELHFDSFILFTDNDIYRSFYAKEILKPQLSIYYRRDNLQPMPYWKKHVPRLEPLLISKYDLVVCNSPQLAKFAKQYNQQTFDVGQGVNLSSYKIENITYIPEEIQAIKKPIIGYIGDITSLRLDINTIYQLALKNQDVSFVLVGSKDAVFANHQLNQLPNVHFLGLKPIEQVPNYIYAFDICFNPQLVNEITLGNYPRKIDEFLAFGKPTIATGTHTMQLFKDYVYLCDSIDDYQKALNLALSEDDKQLVDNRITFAQSHSWENSVKKIYESVHKVTKT